MDKSNTGEELHADTGPPACSHGSHTVKVWTAATLSQTDALGSSWNERQWPLSLTDLPLSTWSPPGRKLLITHHPPCSVEVRVFLLSPSEHTVRPLKVAVANRLLSLGYHVAGCSSRTVLSWIWDEDPRKLEHSADLPFITCVSNRLSKSKNGSLCLLHQITEACRVTDERQRGDICSV